MGKLRICFSIVIYSGRVLVKHEFLDRTSLSKDFCSFRCLLFVVDVVFDVSKLFHHDTASMFDSWFVDFTQALKQVQPPPLNNKGQDDCQYWNCRGDMALVESQNMTKTDRLR